MKYLSYTGLMLVVLTAFSCVTETYPPIVENPTYTYRHGQFVWYELGTNDLAASKAFYGELFGWEFNDAAIDEATYSTIVLNGDRIGGMILAPSASQSQWIGALSVADTEKTVEFLSSMGAEPLIGATRVNGRGTMALIKDAQNAIVSLVHSSAGDPPLNTADTNGWLWMELWSDDPEASAEFYSKTLGYEVEDMEIDDKPYWIFNKNEGPVAGLARNAVENMPSQWVPYIRVSDPARMAQRAEELGANVLLKPTDTIRKGSVAVVADPNGAIFCMQKWPVN